MKKIDRILEILKSNCLRITQTRISVAEVLLKNEDKLLTSEEIFQLIKDSKAHKCDQVSVYRILTKFVELRIIEKNNFQGEASKYSLRELDKLGTKALKHEHYFKCNRCQIIVPFTRCYVPKMEKELRESGYTNLEHHLEIKGLCPDCSSS